MKEEASRIFFAAILISLLWHLFWLSTIAIVSRPDVRNVRFSKVSFLGPLLGKGAMELAVRPKERSFLEERYIAVAKLLQTPTAGIINVPVGYESGSDPFHARDEKLIALIDEALSGEKLEPSSDE